MNEFFTINYENDQQSKVGFLTEQNSDSKSKKISKKVFWIFILLNIFKTFIKNFIFLKKFLTNNISV